MDAAGHSHLTFESLRIRSEPGVRQDALGGAEDSASNRGGNMFSEESEYLVFTVNQSRYGIPHVNVVSVLDAPDHTAVPHMPPEVRGVIPFREGNVPLFDLRVHFGWTPRDEETRGLIETMAQRKQDHINWLTKLKEEVHGRQEISVQTNPHKCAFGKWYDRFESDNLNLNNYMQRFDAPHREIHQVAVEAGALVRGDRWEEAEHLIQLTEHGVLARLIELFDGIEDQVRKYLWEYAIILQDDGNLFSIVVDDINFFSRLNHVEHPLPSGVTMGGDNLVQALGRYREEGCDEEQDILLLDIARLAGEESLESATAEA